MRDYQSLTHTTWDCKYHVVFIPKRRNKAIFGAIRRHFGKVLHELAHRKAARLWKGTCSRITCTCASVFHRSISVSYVVGYIKGKSAISITRKFMGKAKNFAGENFWERGYFVSTLELDEEMVRAYIRHQGKRTSIMTSSSLACDAAFRRGQLFARYDSSGHGI